METVTTPARNAETPVVVNLPKPPAANAPQQEGGTPIRPVNAPSTTPGPRAVSGTPAMPPPPLRSAMKK